MGKQLITRGKLMYTSEEAKKATTNDLAQSILDCADGSPIGDSLAMTAAKELANRILPHSELTEGVGQIPRGNSSKGMAELSALEKRMISQTRESLGL